MKYVLALTVSLVSLSALVHNKGIDVIYGEDNRKDVFESTDSALVDLSKSTAAMIEMGNLKALS